MSRKPTTPAPILAADILAALDALPDRTKRPYSPAEDEALRLYVGRRGFRDLASVWEGLFGVHRTAAALADHARQMGLAAR